jgi:hypothetical protein
VLIVTAPVEMLKDCREPDSYPRQLTEPRQVKARRFSLSSCNLLSISLEGAGSRLIKPQHDPVSKFVPLLFQICEAASPPRSSPATAGRHGMIQLWQASAPNQARWRSITGAVSTCDRRGVPGP